jgi:hypothetical protein
MGSRRRRWCSCRVEVGGGFANGPHGEVGQGRDVQAARSATRDYLAIALEYVLDGDWNDPQFLESLRERATRVSLREGEGGTVALQVKAGS